MLDLPTPKDTVTVFVPIKNFHRAKSRMSPGLTGEMRIRLARWFAFNTVTTFLNAVQTYAICDDEETFEELQSMGLLVIKSPLPGLNQSVNYALTWAQDNGVAYTFVAHSDLPLVSNEVVEELLELRGSNFVVVPDRWGIGTNLLGIPSTVKMRAKFGKNSFADHTECDDHGYKAEVLRSKALECDIDTISDLHYVLERYPRLPFSKFCHRTLDVEIIRQIPV